MCFNSIGDAFSDGWDAVSGGVSGLTDDIKSQVEALGIDPRYIATSVLQHFIDTGNWLADGWDAASSAFSAVADIPDDLANAAASVKNEVSGFLNSNLFSSFDQLGHILDQLGDGAFGELAQFGDVGQALRDASSSLSNAVLDNYADISGQLQQMASDAIATFGKLVGSAGDFVQLASRQVLDAAAQAAGYGGLLDHLIDRGLGNLDFPSALNEVVDNIITATVMPTIDKIYYQMLDQVSDAAKNGLLPAVVNAYSAARSLGDTVLNSSVLQDLVSTFSSQIQQAFDEVVPAGLQLLTGTSAIANDLASMTAKDIIFAGRLGVTQIYAVGEDAVVTLDQAATAALSGVKFAGGNIALTADGVVLSAVEVEAAVAAGVSVIEGAGAALTLQAMAQIESYGVQLKDATEAAVSVAQDDLGQLSLSLTQLALSGVRTLEASGDLVLHNDEIASILDAGFSVVADVGHEVTLVIDQTVTGIPTFVTQIEASAAQALSINQLVDFVDRGGKILVDAGASLSAALDPSQLGVLLATFGDQIKTLIDEGVTFTDSIGTYAAIFANVADDWEGEIANVVVAGVTRIYVAAGDLVLIPQAIERYASEGVSFLAAAGHQITVDLDGLAFDALAISNLVTAGVTEITSQASAIEGDLSQMALAVAGGITFAASAGVKAIDSGDEFLSLTAEQVSSLVAHGVTDIALSADEEISGAVAAVLAASDVAVSVVDGAVQLTTEELSSFTPAMLGQLVDDGFTALDLDQVSVGLERLADDSIAAIDRAGRLLEQGAQAAVQTAEALGQAGVHTIEVLEDETIDAATALLLSAEGIALKAADGVEVAVSTTQAALDQLSPDNLNALIDEGVHYLIVDGEKYALMANSEVEALTGEDIETLALHAARIYATGGVIGLGVAVLDKLATYNTPISGPLGTIVEVVDTAYSISTLNRAAIIKLAAIGATAIVAKEGIPGLDLDTSLEISNLAMSVASNSRIVQLADEASKLTGITPDQIASVAQAGFTEVKAIGSDIAVTADQFASYVQHGVDVAVDAGHQVVVDAGNSLATVIDDIADAPWMGMIDVTADAVIDLAHATALIASGIAVKVESGVELAVQLTGDQLATVTLDQIASLAQAGITTIESAATTVFDVTQFEALIAGGLTVAADAGHSIGVKVASGLDAVVDALSAAPWVQSLEVAGQLDTDLAHALTLARAGLNVTVDAGDEVVTALSAAALHDLSQTDLSQLLSAGLSVLSVDGKLTEALTGDALAALAPASMLGLAESGIDHLYVAGAADVGLSQALAIAQQGLDVAASGALSLTADLASLLALTTDQAAHLVASGLSAVTLTGTQSLTASELDALTSEGFRLSGVDGSAANDVVIGADTTATVFDLSQGGDDTAIGGTADDGFYMGAALTAADHIDGDGGTNNQVALNGDYAGGNALTLGPDTLSNIQLLAVDAGHDYTIVADDATLAAGTSMKIYAGLLNAGDTFTFDGSHDTDGTWLYYGGAGNDHVTGGAGNDGFFFGPDRYDAAHDIIDGGGGTRNEFALEGYYDGANSVTLTSASLTHIQQVDLLGGPANDPDRYDVTFADNLVDSGGTMIVWATQVTTSSVINAGAESDAAYTVFGGHGADTITTGGGNDVIWGNGGADTLTGGLGADTYAYGAVTESTSSSYDTVDGFVSGTDQFKLVGTTVSGVDQQVTTGILDSGSNFDTELTVAVNALNLAAGHAVLFTASAGTLAGETFLVVDANGQAGYQAGQDYVIHLANPPATISTADFIHA